MQRAEERVAYTLERVLDASDSEREGISHFGFIFPVELLNGFTPHPISSQAIVGESFNMRRASRIQIRDISLPFDRLFFKKERRRKKERRKEKKEFSNGVIFIFMNAPSVKVNPQILKVL